MIQRASSVVFIISEGNPGKLTVRSTANYQVLSLVFCFVVRVPCHVKWRVLRESRPRVLVTSILRAEKP
jgi:hypothetical protein